MSSKDEKIRAVKFDGYALAGCADRAGVVVYRMVQEKGVMVSTVMMFASDWDRFADEVLAALAAAQGQPEKESGRFGITRMGLKAIGWMDITA